MSGIFSMSRQEKGNLFAAVAGAITAVMFVAMWIVLGD